MYMSRVVSNNNERRIRTNNRVWKHISPTRKDRVLIDKLSHGNG
jgi:hypothetical protein